ncbi:acyl-CoA dehydrogenase C-terminal domain-containing protein [Microbulbifer sp. 2304DJ12-6]|uniref:acyl-CoA dehydrogenase C-terminal domain-containing protein n=1 Tax=Microbulbifer sp. 2304DJ12-6 TaxID=3233340 RepID=UPI0039B04390
MTDVKMPLRDLRFVMREMLGSDAHYASLGYGEVTPDVVDAILEEGAKFCENVLVPLNQIGDQQGCTWNDGEVTTPAGFKEAYRQFVEAGWPALPHNPEYGGQGLPPSLGTVLSEMVGIANWSWGMYPGLSHGAMNTLEAHGTAAQKNTYLTKLVEGSWTGTMCLTEPHCGTDLGILRTKAEPNHDGTYAITGTKIFISAGEHDMTENIVHIVLARLPDAPAGTKGISLFIVPKFLPNTDGSAGERNRVVCGSLEHKMGIHGNATAVLNFDGAKGFLIGEPNKGLNYMFTFMNTARLGTALQGLAHAEIGFQKSLAYARERLQMRSLSGTKNPQGPADPIIVHPDVRRMLLTQKAFAEGSRMLVVHCAQLVDITHRGSEEAKKEAEDLLALLTPIAKAFITEVGFESANLGLQCFGGHGYITEWGMEQNVRDARISTIYEGTTGIQALDLLGRKVLLSQGELLRGFTKKIHKFCQAEIDNEALAPFVIQLQALNKQWGDLTLQVGSKAMENADEVGAASVDYLMYSGYTVLAYLWARAARVANLKLAEGAEGADFYRAKVATARFYFERILPRTASHATAMQNGAASLMELDAAHFAF